MQFPQKLQPPSVYLNMTEIEINQQYLKTLKNFPNKGVAGELSAVPVATGKVMKVHPNNCTFLHTRRISPTCCFVTEEWMCSAITGRTLCSLGHESMRRVKVLAECHKSAWHLLPRTLSARVVRSVALHKPYIIFIVLIAATCVFWQLTAAGSQKEPLRCFCRRKDMLLKAEDVREGM